MQRGATAVQLLTLFVPVFLGMMGFAIDLGRLYMARSELQAAANSMALAAASQLIGTDASTGVASTYGRLTIENNSGYGNRYDFGGSAVGQTNGSLTSEVPEPQYFGTLAEALADSGATAGSAARYVRVNIMGETPIVFWGLIPIAQDRRVGIQVAAVAGRSAPLCQVCGTEPIVVPALDPTDATDFGFVQGTRYTFGYNCSGQGTPAILPGGGARVDYVLINRLNTETQIFTAESTQLFRAGAAGLASTPNRALGCFNVNAAETLWAGADPLPCLQNGVPALVQNFLCGLAMRFDAAVAGNCTAIPEVDTISASFTPDTDVADAADYAAYTGNGKRIITVPVVDSITNLSAMTVLGFRQFLVQPALNQTTINTADQNGRFVVTYIGSVAPVKQGSMRGCTQTAGPGMVVLHR
jgi:Flp pilus assembly protein TadG